MPRLVLELSDSELAALCYAADAAGHSRVGEPDVKRYALEVLRRAAVEDAERYGDDGGGVTPSLGEDIADEDTVIPF